MQSPRDSVLVWLPSSVKSGFVAKMLRSASLLVLVPTAQLTPKSSFPSHSRSNGG
jgi:hypothetical protein